MNNISLVVFLIGTIAISIFTWQFSIIAKRPRSIPRFFSFECILLLVLLNAPVWFEQPFKSNQVLSWILLFGSIPFGVTGIYLLWFVGRPTGDFENTSKLVTIGLYRFIRHPLYASLLLLGTGIFFKNMTIATTALAFLNFIALIATARQEEKEMLVKFWGEYTAYMKKTKMVLPYIF